MNQSNPLPEFVSMNELEAKVAALEARFARLEAIVLKRGGVAGALDRLIHSWPGPFTQKQLLATLRDVRPDLGDTATDATAMQKLYKLERQGVAVRLHEGAGSVGTVWQCIKSKVRARCGRTHDYESGFRSIVRAAIASDDLPETFALADLQSWMRRHLPNTAVPYGSWSSTLYKLQQRQELVVVKPAHTVPRKIYARGPKRVLPSGSEMAEMEQAWSEFKASLAKEGLPLEAPEMASPLARAEVAA